MGLLLPIVWWQSYIPLSVTIITANSKSDLSCNFSPWHEESGIASISISISRELCWSPLGEDFLLSRYDLQTHKAQRRREQKQKLCKWVIWHIRDAIPLDPVPTYPGRRNTIYWPWDQKVSYVCRTVILSLQACLPACNITKSITVIPLFFKPSCF